MAKSAELGLILSLVDEVSGSAKKVRGELQDIGKEAGGLQGILSQVGKVGLVAVAAGAAAASAAIVAGTKMAWDAAMTMDSAMDTIQIATGASNDELDMFRTVLEDVAANTHTGATIETISGTLATLGARLEASDEELYSLTLGLTELSQMTGGDATKNAELFSRTLGDWGVDAEAATGLMHQMYVATQETGIGFDSLNDLMVRYGAPMRNFGFSIEDSIALLSKWEKEGVNTELVMGSLRIAAGKFAKEGKPLRESLFETFEAIQNMTDGSEALALGMEIFGARAGPDMTAAIREGRFAIDDLVDMMGDAQGAIFKTAYATEDWPEMWARMKNKIITAIAPIGEELMRLGGIALKNVAPMVDEALDWISDKAGGAIQAVERGIDAFFTSLELGQGPLEGFKNALWTMLPPGVAADITGIITKVQELAGKALEGDWEGLGKDLWGLVQEGITKTISFGTDLAEKLRGKLATALGLSGSNDSGAGGDDSWGAIGRKIRDRVVEGIVNLSGVIADFTGKLKGKVDSEEGKADAQATGNAIGEWIIETIRSLFSQDEQGETLIGELIDNMKRAAINLHDASAANGGRVAASIVAGMTDKIESQEEIDKLSAAWARSIARSDPIGRVIEGWRDVQEWAGSRTLGPVGQWLDERLPWSGTPGMNAMGTSYWRGGPTWVGERGPEIVVPPQGSQILSNEQSQGVGGTTINIAAGAIVVHAPNAEAAGIGVLSALRGLGVPVGV